MRELVEKRKRAHGGTKNNGEHQKRGHAYHGQDYFGIMFWRRAASQARGPTEQVMINTGNLLVRLSNQPTNQRGNVCDQRFAVNPPTLAPKPTAVAVLVGKSEVKRIEGIIEEAASPLPQPVHHTDQAHRGRWFDRSHNSVTKCIMNRGSPISETPKIQNHNLLHYALTVDMYVLLKIGLPFSAT
ncbi:hypothetical protein CBL_06447 [Carabus blaptoides fortunei]